MNLHK